VKGGSTSHITVHAFIRSLPWSRQLRRTRKIVFWGSGTRPNWMQKFLHRGDPSASKTIRFQGQFFSTIQQ
ncbi:Uncharacterized protein APZ42_007354, partial [Daphnia magna]